MTVVRAGRMLVPNCSPHQRSPRPGGGITLDDHRFDTDTVTHRDALAWLVRAYGTAAAAALLDIPTAEFRACVDGTRAVPAVVAGRVRYLVRVTDQLVGAYNAMGLRRWWQRPRAALDGRTPRSALGGDWDPAGPAAQAVLALARGLNA